VVRAGEAIRKTRFFLYNVSVGGGRLAKNPKAANSTTRTDSSFAGSGTTSGNQLDSNTFPTGY